MITIPFPSVGLDYKLIVRGQSTDREIGSEIGIERGDEMWGLEN